MYFIYDFFIFLYALLYLPYLLITKRWYPGFGMRLGLLPPEIINAIKSKPNIWVHAVSVGEVMVLDGVLGQLKAKYPKYQIVLSVTTKTGYALACQRFKDKALVIPSPLDLSFITRAYVTLIKPHLYIVVETEIWPNLFNQIAALKIPLIIINGRISDKSFGRYKAIRFLLKGVLTKVSCWCMQSQSDKHRIIHLGAPAAQVFVTGNIKFDDLFASSGAAIDLGFQDHQECWVAGSTHPGEEAIVLDTYQALIKTNPNWRLVIAPRHVERAGQIVSVVESYGFKAVRLSMMSTQKDKESVIIVDTIGQLRVLYSQASLVFVGKSLAGGGGQNMIEPAFYAKAIIIGPMVENFRDIVASFKASQAIVQVKDSTDFKKEILHLAADPKRREVLGKAAKSVITRNQGATLRTLTHIAGFLR